MKSSGFQERLGRQPRFYPEIFMRADDDANAVLRVAVEIVVRAASDRDCACPLACARVGSMRRSEACSGRRAGHAGAPRPCCRCTRPAPQRPRGARSSINRFSALQRAVLAAAAQPNPSQRRYCRLPCESAVQHPAHAQPKERRRRRGGSATRLQASWRGGGSAPILRRARLLR